MLNFKAGPVSEAVNSVGEFMNNFVRTLSGGMDPASSKWLVDQSVYFQVVSAMVLLGLFFWEIQKENTHRKGSDRIIGLMLAIRFIGLKLLLIPLIVLAPAISGAIGRSTMSAFAATTAAAKRVAEVGDGLITQAGTYWDLQIRGGAQTVLAMSGETGEKLSPEERKAAEAIQATYGAAGTELNNAKMALIEAQAAGASPAVISSAKRRLTDAQGTFTSANQALLGYLRRIEPKLNGSAEEIEIAKAQIETMKKAVANQTRLGYSDELVANLKGSIAKLEAKVAAGPQKPSIGPSDAPRILWDFATHIGFYACCLPALLGIIAAVVMVLKEAFGLMQFGAKVDVLKGLGLTLSAFFAPIFMLAFLFPKTEQFGWKYVSFLFSIYFALIGITYACGVVTAVGVGALSAQVSSLVAVPTGYLAKEASQALFMASVGIGLKAVGVGMITGFFGEIVRSALQVGQGPFSGSFNA